MKSKWIILYMVVVLGCPVWALDLQPGEGIHMGNLTLSPFIEGAYTYDSNVLLLEDNEIDDYFIDLMGGLALVNRTDRMVLRGRGWVMFRMYDEITWKDHTDYGERVSLTMGRREKVAFVAQQEYRKTADFVRSPGSVDFINPESQNLVVLSEDRTIRVKRELHDIGLAVGKNLTDKSELDAGYSYSSVNYETNALFDWLEHKLQLEAAIRLTDKTSFLVTGQYGIQDSENARDQYEFYVIRGGLKTLQTDKLQVKSGFGVEFYDKSFSDVTTTNLDETIFSFDITGKWRSTDKLTFQMSLRNGMQPASQFANNTKRVTMGSLSAEYKMRQSILLTLTGTYRKDDYGSTEIINEDRVTIYSKQLVGHARITYAPPRKFYSAYGEVRYEDLEATWIEYIQLRASLGLSLRY